MAWRATKQIKKKKMPAANERFAASGGVSRPKGSANLQVLHPAQTAVSRHLRQAAPTLHASRRQWGETLKHEKKH